MSAQANGLGEPPTQTKLSPNGAALNTTTPCDPPKRHGARPMDLIQTVSPKITTRVGSPRLGLGVMFSADHPGRWPGLT